MRIFILFYGAIICLLFACSENAKRNTDRSINDEISTKEIRKFDESQKIFLCWYRGMDGFEIKQVLASNIDNLKIYYRDSIYFKKIDQDFVERLISDPYTLNWVSNSIFYGFSMDSDIHYFKISSEFDDNGELKAIRLGFQDNNNLYNSQNGHKELLSLKDRILTSYSNKYGNPRIKYNKTAEIFREVAKESGYNHDINTYIFQKENKNIEIREYTLNGGLEIRYTLLEDFLYDENEIKIRQKEYMDSLRQEELKTLKEI